LIVDDHAGFRDTARLIAERAGFDVVGEAADFESATAAVVALRPDAVLLDVMLPDGEGFDLAATLARTVPAPRVVLTSSRGAATYGGRLSGAGISGFIEKQRLTPAALAALLQ
jgi:DNA-binding NarL/FixJ family response regulator